MRRGMRRSGRCRRKRVGSAQTKDVTRMVVVVMMMMMMMNGNTCQVKMVELREHENEKMEKKKKTRGSSSTNSLGARAVESQVRKPLGV